MLGSRPANMSAPGLDLEWLLSLIPPSEAKLYRALVGLISTPGAESPIGAGRRIQIVELARRTGLSKRWVIELLQRLEEKNLIRTEGGSGTVKWIRLLPPGVPLLGGSKADQPTQKEARWGKTKAPRVTASQPKRVRKETATFPGTDVKDESPVEKPAEIPARRREVAMPSTAPGVPAVSNPVVPATVMPPAPSVVSGGPGTGNPMRGARIARPSSPGGPAPGNPAVAPGAKVTPSSPTAAEAPAIPAKRISPCRSTKKIPAGDSHWESAPIEELVAYACSLPVTPELIDSLKTPGMTGGLLLLALERLCQRIERYRLKPCQDRWELISTLRTILSDL